MKTTISLFAGACALLCACSVQANLYQVTVNTQPLEGNANAPFYVDFQMNYGSGSGNSATLNDFNFAGGSPVGTAFSYSGAGQGAIGAYGTAAGDLSAGVTLSDNASSQFNGFYQQFTPGSTLTFNVNLSANGTGQTPDDLIFSIDDYTTYQIYTTAPDQVSLAYFQINPYLHNPAISVNTYIFAPGDTGDNISGVTVSVVPEPAAYGVFAAAGLLVVCLGTQLRRKQI